MVIYYIVRVITKTFLRIFFPVRFVGNKKACQDPCVIVSNHLTLADAFIVGMLFKGKIYVLCKKESFKSKPVSWFLTTLGGIPIDRDNPDAATIMKCFKMLKSGEKILIFPEGTRNKTKEKLLPLKSGAALFAIKSKVPVQPVYIDGKSRFLRRNTVKVGEPFYMDEFFGKKLTDDVLKEADSLIRDKLLETSEIPSQKNKKAE